MTVSTAQIRKWITSQLKQLEFVKEHNLYVRQLEHTVAAVDIYASRFGPAVHVDVGVVDLRYSHRDVTETIFWHFSTRLQYIFNGEERQLVVDALNRDSLISNDERKELLVGAINGFDRRLREKWQNEVWLDSLIEVPESEYFAMHADYRTALIRHNNLRLRS